MRDRDLNKEYDAMFSHFIGPRGIEPKLKLKFDTTTSGGTSLGSLEELVDRIIIGPTQASPMSKLTLERMLVSYGKNSLAGKIHNSGIPFRP